MKNMSDELLIESYYKAITLKLDPQFISLLENEIECRALCLNIKVSS